MRVLAAVDTVHTAAAICDYLGDRLDGADAVVAVTVVPGDAGADATDDAPSATAVGGSDPDRDGREALNVTSVRLAGIDVTTELRRGEPAGELLAAAAEHDVDEIVIGASAGVPDAGVPEPEVPDAEGGRASTAADGPDSTAQAGLGSTASAVLSGADCPVVVLPSASV